MNIVLFQPDIPQNTGNIARTCAVTGATLHIIEPCGFRLDEKAVRRAGLDYWPLLSKEIHPSLEDFLNRHGDKRLCLITTLGDRTYEEIPFGPECFVVFGRESAGLPESLHRRFERDRYRIPMKPLASARSLNLSNAVSIVLYEGLRQSGFAGLA